MTWVCMCHPKYKISLCQCQMPAPMDLQRILWAQLQASLGLTLVVAVAQSLPSKPSRKRHFCRKGRTMSWKRFGFAFRDAVCAELVTALERYLASDYRSQPYPLGTVSCVGRGTWGGGWGGRGAWNEKGNRWQDSAWKLVPPPRPSTLCCLQNILFRQAWSWPSWASDPPRPPPPERSHSQTRTRTTGPVGRQAALGRGEQVSGFGKVGGTATEGFQGQCCRQCLTSSLLCPSLPPL